MACINPNSPEFKAALERTGNPLLAEIEVDRGAAEVKLERTESSTASPKTIAIVKDFLNRIGVKIENLKEIVVDGQKQDANGVAKIMQSLIQVVEGKESTALPEEAMHFAVEIIRQTNPALFTQLLKEINDYNILKSVIAEYANHPAYKTKDGKPDILKLKMEAIAKLLTEKVINQNEGITEKPELLAKVENWWLKILDFIKELLHIKSGFDKAAISILSGENIGTAEDIRAEENTVYLQKKGKPSQEEVYNSLKDISNKIEKKDDGYYVDGKKIPKRVTDFVKEWYEQRFGNGEISKSERQKEVDTLKADKGTDGHKDLENAFTLFVDENGYLRDEPLDDAGYTSLLDPEDRTMYEMLRDNLQKRLNSFPEGTRFMKEITVFNGRGIAGTIDLLAIEKDGKVNILDWKFMDLDVDKYDTIPWYKVGGWNEQMKQYKAILRQNYGIKSEDFNQTRMIPIRAKYSKGNIKAGIMPVLQSIEIGDVVVKNIEKDYLVPVPLMEETTGKRKIDKLLEKLRDAYKKLSEQEVAPEKKVEKAEDLNALYSAIRELQLKENIKPLINQAKLLNRQIQNTIDKYENEWKDKNPMSVKEKKVSDFIEEIEDAKSIVETYSSLYTDLKFLFADKELTEEDEKLLSDLKAVSEEAKDYSNNLDDLDEEFVVKFAAGREAVDESILSPSKIIKGFSRWFLSTSSIQLKTVEALYKKANRVFGFATIDTVDETKRLQKIKEDYDKLASTKGWSIKDYFNIIKKKDKNELIDQYNKDFYIQLKSHINDKDLKWVRENVDGEAYAEHLKGVIEREIERLKGRVRFIDVDKDETVKAELEKEIQKVKRNYDISTPTANGWYQYKELKKFPIKSWETAEWKELNAPGNEAAKVFYDYIIERNNKYADLGYLNKSVARTFLPFVRKGVIEKIMFGGDVAIGEQFLRSISIDEGDVGYGKINPTTGELINSVPKYLTRELDKDYSTDIFRTMALYNEFAIKYKYIKDIEAQARGLVRLERNKKAIITSWYGKAQRKGGEVQYTRDNNSNAELIDSMVKNIIYGQKYIQSETFDHILGTLGDLGERLNKKLGMKIFPEGLEGRQITINKTIDGLNNFFQLKTLGLNLFSPTSNFFGGNFQSIINAGKYFTETDFAASELWVMSNKLGGKDQKKAIAALEYFLPLTDNYNKEIAKTLSINKLSQENVQEFLMTLMRKSDKAVQTFNFFAYLRNSVVIDDEVVNAREYLREQPEYADMYVGTQEERKARDNKFEEDVQKLIEEKGVMKLGEIVNDEFVIPGVERKSDSVIKVRRIVQQLNKDALGNLSEDDVRLINLNIYGKSFMVFKNWIPRLVDVRISDLKYNNATEAYEWGRMRMIYNMLGEDITRTISSFQGAFTMDDKTIDFMKKMYEKKRADYEEETGRPLEMTESEFVDLMRQNIKNQLVDLVFLLTLLSLFAAIKAGAPDDEEDPIVKNQYKLLIRAADKIKDELMYFYDPTNLLNLVSSGIFPAMSMLNDFKRLFWNFLEENYAIAIGDEKLEKKTKVIKYVMKSFPGINAMSQYIPMFAPDLAKDLGIKAQSQARPVGL